MSEQNYSGLTLLDLILKTNITENRLPHQLFAFGTNIALVRRLMSMSPETLEAFIVYRQLHEKDLEAAINNSNAVASVVRKKAKALNQYTALTDLVLAHNEYRGEITPDNFANIRKAVGL